MRDNEEPSFSQIICSAQPVRTAFTTHRPTRVWWNLILALHGKSVGVSLSQAEQNQRVADGFKFYAWLYRFLAVIFLLLAPIFIIANVAENSTSSSYWAAASFLAGIYLWGVSGLGYAGAKSYGSGSNSSLIAFMVMIVAFLSMFVAVVSVVAHQFAWLGVVPNLIAASTLFVFGVGSYMIEVIYLATEHQEQ